MNILKSQDLVENIESMLSLIRMNNVNFLEPIIEKLNNLSEKMKKCEVIIPLLGEFSSGKSSLINSLIGINVLPVDITPTTFTVNEVKFSSEKNIIEIEIERDRIERFEDLSILHSIDYKSAKLIRIFVKNDIIPNNITLVDTPGFSSIIAEHEEVISSYLPKADCIFLINDINQATLTKTTMRVLEYGENLDKDIFLILTKSDTKSDAEIKEIRDYFNKNFSFFSEVIITSSKKKILDELLLLIDKINKKSLEINLKNGTKKFIELCELSKNIISQQLEDAKLDLSEIENKLRETKNIMKKLENDFNDRLLKLQVGIEDSKSKAIDYFYKYIEGKKSYLVDVFFSNSEKFKTEFENIIQESIEKSASLFEREVKIYIEDFKIDIEMLGFDTKVSTGFEGIMTGFGETLKIVLLNLLLPGGLIYAILGRIVLMIVEKVPKIGKFAGLLTTIVNTIIGEIGKLVGKSYISGKINESLIKASEAFDYELTQKTELLIREISHNLKREFINSLKSYEERLNDLYQEKQQNERNFQEYKTKIKNLLSQIEKLCLSSKNIE